MPILALVRRASGELARKRTWAEFAYALIALPLGILGFVYTIVTLALSAGLFVTFLGLPLLAVTNQGSRLLAAGVRRQANVMLGADVAAPPRRLTHERGMGYLRAHITDPSAWRARLYLLLKLPVAVFTVAVTLSCYVYGLGGTTYAIWRPFLPCDTSPDGACHRAAGFNEHYYLDTPLRIAATTVIGVVLLLAAPWVVRAVLVIDRLLIAWLLGPNGHDARVRELERTRAVAVDDSAATLRRIERDLHDGAQARLVALAMNVGLAREKLAEGADPAETSRLLDSAHATAKEAISELRDLARGIHPPVLDAGLDAALATLAAHSAIPVRLQTAIAQRPEPAIETMAYFCAAELLTNAGKHSGARAVTIDARTAGNTLRLTVADDGHGGAVIGAGSGLTGLAERIATVDGRLTVDSPAGGPTTVSIALPLRTGRTTSA